MTLEVYLGSTEVTVTVDLVDEMGNVLNVNSVDYRVVDQNNAELVARTAVAGFTAGDSQAVIVVPQAFNTMAASSTREVRSVELFCATDAGTLGFSRSYGLETIDPLKIATNTFQNFAMAQLTAMDIPNIDAWHAASEQQKVAALIDAREHIVQLNFNLLNSNVNFGQDQLNYVPEGSFQSAYVARNSLFLFNGNLNLLNETQFNQLPERFKKALRQAQVVEANAILGGNTDDVKRGSGIVEETIGESSVKFRTAGVPLRLPVCRRALGYVSYYVTFAKKIGRGG